MITNPINNVSDNYQHPELLIENVVDSLRSTGNILSITDNTDNTYTLVVSNISTFYSGEYITISGTTGFNSTTQLIVSYSIQNKQIVISKTSGVAIPATKGMYKCNAPYYAFDKHIGQANELTQKDLSQYYANQKYPCILLLLDLKTDVLDDLEFYSQTDLNIFFGMLTSQDYTTRERLTNVFKPVLFPLYNAFVTALTDSSYVERNSTDIIPHTRYERYFLGSAGTNQNVWNSRVDVIETAFNQIKFYKLLNC